MNVSCVLGTRYQYTQGRQELFVHGMYVILGEKRMSKKTVAERDPWYKGVRVRVMRLG